MNNETFDLTRFGEVATFNCGRDTHHRREPTDFEEQLLRELAEKDARIEELEIEVESAYDAGYAQGATDA